ncbi:18120_t:CDS:1, partial [Racocetra fulgida]
AALNGYVKTIEILLKYGSNINAINVKDHTEVIRILIEYGTSVNDNINTLLYWAAKSGYVEVVNTLIKYGANVDAVDHNNQTVLRWAAENSYVRIVKTLIEHGANVDAINNHGQTVLHWAAENGNIEVVKALIKHRANVNFINSNSCTALHMAARNGHIEIVKILIKHDVNINTINDNYSSISLVLASENGHTALYRAARNGHMESFKILLEHGADINAINNFGYTILHLAARNDVLILSLTLVPYSIKILKYNKETSRHKEAFLNVLGIDENLCKVYGKVYGGVKNKFLVDHVKPWLDSLNNYTTWKIIEYDNILPIFNILDDELCMKVLNTAYGSTLLCEAALNGYVKTIEILLKYGSNINDVKALNKYCKCTYFGSFRLTILF